MADENAGSGETLITFNVKLSSEPKYTLTLAPSTTIGQVKQKLSEEEYANVPADRQRLIYSGRVLKDDDTLQSHNVKEGHTIHLVRSVASSQPRVSPSAPQSSSTPTPTSNPAAGVPANLAAGTGNSILSGLTGARYAGFTQLPGAGVFGPDGGMGPPPDTDQMLSMLENPQFQSTMNEALQNPQIIEMMIQQNPMLRDMGPGVRQMLQSPEFRRMLTDPNMIRSMSQMQRGMGGGPFGQRGGNPAFPAPGVTNTTAQENRDGQTANNTQNTPQNTVPQFPFNPFAMPGATPPPGSNPFGALFGFQPGAQQPGAPSTGGTNTTQEGNTAPTQGATNPNQQRATLQSLFNPAFFNQAQNPNDPQQPLPSFNLQDNPFLQNPALFNQFMEALGGPNPPPGDAGTSQMAALLANLGTGASAPAAPADTRPPEERYADQLRQLNDMGFHEFERNIEALRRTGGSVQGAVEYLLGNP
ncbi:hypothetical protein FQN57_006643 [Myotisia sp. PD_48]|nr:hypothetical protein FQN57_006643 [Myotisia sp. PD_48]